MMRWVLMLLLAVPGMYAFGQAHPAAKPEEHRPGFAPSIAVHVSRVETEEHASSRGKDFLSLRGYTLKEALEELYGFSGPRMALPAALEAREHYDFQLVLSRREGAEAMRERMRAGVLEHFHLTATPESRTVAVYVLTAVPGRRPEGVKARGGGSDFEVESIEDPGETDEWKPLRLEAVRGVAFVGTLPEFRRQLEAQLDRPVVDETGVAGEYAISIKAGPTDRNDFLERLRAEAGLVLTARERKVPTLAIGIAER